MFEHKFNEVVAVALGKTVDNVNHEIRWLGIVEEENADSDVSSSNLVIPDELPRDEEPLKILYMNIHTKKLRIGTVVVDHTKTFRSSVQK